MKVDKPNQTKREASLTCLSRRQVLMGASAAGVSIIAAPTLASASAIIVNVTSPPYNANPSSSDNTAAFQSALNAIANANGGVLQIPPGSYNLLSGLTYSGNSSVSIIGYGQELSVLVVNHTSTAIAISLSANNNCATIRDLGFVPLQSGGNAGTAIAVTVPSAASAWQNCLIEDVDFGVAYPNYTSFGTAVNLTNVFQSKVRNVNCHANVAGGTFVALNGRCIDNRVLDCNCDGYAIGVSVGAYSEGLHLTDCTLICGTAITTGASNYSSGINLLGLYVSGCEFNCTGVVMNLYQVNSAWISDTDIYGPKVATGSVTCSLQGSERVEISDCLFGGFFNTSQPTNQIGISTSSSSGAVTGSTIVDNCEFENLTTAIQLGSGTANFTASGIRMLAAGDGTLVNNPITYGSQMQQVVVDNSGNTTNNVSWFTTSTAAKTTSSRVTYER